MAGPETPQQPREGFIAVGRVLRPWGLQGALKVESLTDFPDRFEPGERLWLLGAERVVAESRWQKGALFLKLAGIDDPDAAERLRGALLEAPESSLRPLDEGEYYNHQLIGLSVRTGAGEELGEVRELLPTGGNAVLVVRGPGGETLLPFIDQVVKSVDLAAGRIVVDLVDGLPNIPAPPVAAPAKRYQRGPRRPRPLTHRPTPAE